MADYDDDNDYEEEFQEADEPDNFDDDLEQANEQEQIDVLPAGKIKLFFWKWKKFRQIDVKVLFFCYPFYFHKIDFF